MANKRGIKGLWERTRSAMPTPDLSKGTAVEQRRVITSTAEPKSAVPAGPRPFPLLDLSFPRSPCFAKVLTVPVNERRWIYALVDPRDSTVRYVGMSTSPNHRFDQHCDPSNANYKARPWIAELRAVGLVPRMVVLSVVGWKRWEEAERAWIRYYRRRGRIYNIHVGGKETPAETVRRIGRKIRRFPGGV